MFEADGGDLLFNLRVAKDLRQTDKAGVWDIAHKITSRIVKDVSEFKHNFIFVSVCELLIFLPV